MLGLYVFSLVLGGGLLAASVFGDVFDTDTGDMGLQVDTDLHLGADVDVDTDVGGVDADASHAFKILSIRTLVYALFGFGAVGTVLTLRDGGSTLATLALSLVGAVLSGGAVTGIFHWLKRTEAGHHPGDLSFVGLSGTVTIPLSPAAPGTVVVERGNRRIALRALPHSTSPGPAETWRSVVIVDMENGVARVAPVEEDLTLES